MATLNIGDYNMLDLKNYSNKELQELRLSIDKEMFNRNGDNSFSEYKVGEIYLEKTQHSNHFYIIKKIDTDYIYTDYISIIDNYLSYYEDFEYTFRNFKKNKDLTKIDITSKELIDWYEELDKKVRIIESNAEKEIKTLINLYLEKIKKI